MTRSTRAGVGGPRARQHRGRGAALGLCALTLMVGFGVQACLIGRVLDPRDDAGLGATVSTYALCTGSTCTVQGLGWQNTVASSGPNMGGFLYNAYPEASPGAKLELPPGKAAFEIRFNLAGFQPRTVFHHPQYGQLATDASGNPLYGTVLRQPVYLCPTDAIDTDGDTICDLAETRYGTDLTSKDTDKDGLTDDFELFGSDGLDLTFYGANPRHRDIFLEIDYYAGSSSLGAIDFKLEQQGVDKLVAAFAAAPLTNPDQQTGISLHVLVDSPIDPAVWDSDLHLNFPYTLSPPYANWSEFDVLKNQFMDRTRARAFHYAVLAFAGSQGGAPFGGLSRGFGAHDFVMTSGFDSEDMHRQAVGIMHELGHNLGLTHGGELHQFAVDSKPNYLSVMNYLYSGTGLLRDGVDTLDYSRHPIAEVQERSLSEPNGFAPGPGTTESDLARYQLRYCTSSYVLQIPGLISVLVCNAGAQAMLYQPNGTLANASVNIDFNGNGALDLGNVSAELNGNSNMNNVFPQSQNDWTALYYCGGDAAEGGAIAAAGQQPVCPPQAVVAAPASASAADASSIRPLPCLRPH